MYNGLLLFFSAAERDNNKHALGKVTAILDNATWINIHWLPVSGSKTFVWRFLSATV
jgi:hypothetical protein